MTCLPTATIRILTLGATLALAGCSQGGRFSLNLPGGGAGSPSSTPPTLNDPGRPQGPSYDRDRYRDPSSRRVVQASYPPGQGPTPPVAHGPRPDTVSFADRREATTTSNAALVGVFGELSGRPVAVRTRNNATVSDGMGSVLQVSFATEGRCIDPEVNGTGKVIAFSTTMHGPTADIFVKSVTGMAQTQLTTDPADDVMPTFSPDGRRIAFASNRDGNWNLYYMAVDGGNAVQVTFDTTDELHPSWSPDGRTLAYSRFNTQVQDWEIWTVDVENTAVRQRLEFGLFPQWCPDATRPKILFQRATRRGSRFFGVWTLDYIEGEARHLTQIVSASNAALMHPTWSPDGSRIAFVSALEPDRTGSTLRESDVWIINLDGTGRLNVTNGRHANFQPTWGRDGSIFFVSNRDGVENIWAVPTARALSLSPQAPRDSSSVVGVRTDQHGGMP